MHLRRYRRAFLVGLMLLFLLPAGAAVGAGQKGPATHLDHPSAGRAAEADPPAGPLRPVNTEEIDTVGKNVGRGIEKFSDRASTLLGPWVKQRTVGGIPLIKMLICLLLLLGVTVVERLLRWGIRRKIDAIPHRDGEVSWLRLFLESLVRPVRLFVYVYGIYAALSPLYAYFQNPDGTNIVLTAAKHAADIGGTVALFWFIHQLVALLDARIMKWAQGTHSNIDNMLVPLVGKTLRIFIVAIGGMMVLQNLTGLQIGPLLASLGIGGLAVALAAKDSIANFFGTLTILFDKPFQVGDRIKINDFDGSVENVGFRSTRIRLLNGHLVSIPNEKVVNSEVVNISQRPNIRWLTQIGITYDTPPQKVQEAVDILHGILEDHEGMDPELPPRVHFDGFNEWNLNITVVAWYHPPDWWAFQAWLQSTCLQILERFNAAGIDFAFPTRTVHMTGEGKRES